MPFYYFQFEPKYVTSYKYYLSSLSFQALDSFSTSSILSPPPNNNDDKTTIIQFCGTRIASGSLLIIREDFSEQLTQYEK